MALAGRLLQTLRMWYFSGLQLKNEHDGMCLDLNGGTGNLCLRSTWRGEGGFPNGSTLYGVPTRRILVFWGHKLGYLGKTPTCRRVFLAKAAFFIFAWFILLDCCVCF